MALPTLHESALRRTNEGGLMGYRRVQFLGPLAERTPLPVIDPVAHGAGPIVDFLLQDEH